MSSSSSSSSSMEGPFAWVTQAAAAHQQQQSKPARQIAPKPRKPLAHVKWALTPQNTIVLDDTTDTRMDTQLVPVPPAGPPPSRPPLVEIPTFPVAPSFPIEYKQQQQLPITSPTTIADESKMWSRHTQPSMRAWCDQEATYIMGTARSVYDLDADAQMVYHSAFDAVRVLADLCQALKDPDIIDVTKEVEDGMRSRWITRHYLFLRHSKSHVMLMVHRPYKGNLDVIGTEHERALVELAQQFSPISGFVYVNATETYRRLQTDDLVFPEMKIVVSEVTKAIALLANTPSDAPDPKYSCHAPPHVLRHKPIRVAYVCASVNNHGTPLLLVNSFSTTPCHIRVVYVAG